MASINIQKNIQKIKSRDPDSEFDNAFNEIEIKTRGTIEGKARAAALMDRMRRTAELHRSKHRDN